MGVKKEVKMKEKEEDTKKKNKRFLSFAIVQFLITFITGLCKYNNQSTTWRQMTMAIKETSEDVRRSRGRKKN